MGLEVYDCLKRVRNTYRQVDMVGEDRVVNVSDAFEIKKQPPRKVVLVDDVATSCATLTSCAQVLRAAGSEEIWGLTFARG